MLKPLGDATGQFGKSHLGDRDEYLPCAHGFDEFFGNLYHLNAEEEPELPDYPKDPEFKKKFGPRGVLHCLADGKGGQRVTDTGPLTKKRMETIDEEITATALAWMEKQAKAEQPFFLWYNSTAMHFKTHLADKNRGKSGRTTTATGWSPTTSRSASCSPSSTNSASPTTPSSCIPPTTAPRNSWPDGAMTPFRSEKNTNWEGACRVSIVHALAGQDQARSDLERDRLTSTCSRPCWPPPAIRTSSRSCSRAVTRSARSLQEPYRRLQSDALPHRRGEGEPEKVLMYLSDDGDVLAVRVRDYKLNLGHGARCHGSLDLGGAVHPSSEYR